jgi:hypothetical protein
MRTPSPIAGHRRSTPWHAWRRAQSSRLMQAPQHRQRTSQTADRYRDPETAQVRRRGPLALLDLSLGKHPTVRGHGGHCPQQAPCLPGRQLSVVGFDAIQSGFEVGLDTVLVQIDAIQDVSFALPFDWAVIVSNLIRLGHRRRERGHTQLLWRWLFRLSHVSDNLPRA